MLASGDGAPGLATGAAHRSFGFAVTLGGGVPGLCATFGGGVFCCRMLASDDGAPGLATGADQGALGFAFAPFEGALMRLFADAGVGVGVPDRCATFGVAVGPGEEAA
jgi:hypothetical protein